MVKIITPLQVSNHFFQITTLLSPHKHLNYFFQKNVAYKIPVSAPQTLKMVVSEFCPKYETFCPLPASLMIGYCRCHVRLSRPVLKLYLSFCWMGGPQPVEMVLNWGFCKLRRTCCNYRTGGRSCGNMG